MKKTGYYIGPPLKSKKYKAGQGTLKDTPKNLYTLYEATQVKDSLQSAVYCWNVNTTTTTTATTTTTTTTATTTTTTTAVEVMGTHERKTSSVC